MCAHCALSAGRVVNVTFVTVSAFTCRVILCRASLAGSSCPLFVTCADTLFVVVVGGDAFGVITAVRLSALAAFGVVDVTYRTLARVQEFSLEAHKVRRAETAVVTSPWEGTITLTPSLRAVRVYGQGMRRAVLLVRARLAVRVVYMSYTARRA